MHTYFAIVELRKSNLLVEERFAHWSGNGARRSFGGSSGLGHGDMLSFLRISFQHSFNWIGYRDVRTLIGTIDATGLGIEALEE